MRYFSILCRHIICFQFNKKTLRLSLCKELRTFINISNPVAWHGSCCNVDGFLTLQNLHRTGSPKLRQIFSYTTTLYCPHLLYLSQVPPQETSIWWQLSLNQYTSKSVTDQSPCHLAGGGQSCSKCGRSSSTIITISLKCQERKGARPWNIFQLILESRKA